ncbi:MAG: molecular chaperone DnaJ [Nostocales cyanobacterium]|nr:MAG: molecular chaperone DnaJ [Nostocales cyanobacterium]TAF15087.1 MAG: molecular chaperone DnaJ [Nostocales cyanobacterium]
MEYNPYDILGVSQTASKAEITQAVALAMKRQQYPIDVIAKAQKILMKTEERIIADYLRPILPPVQEFQWSDLSSLQQPVPSLSLLAEFDGLDQAIAQALQQQKQEREALPLSLSELFTAGIAACKEGRYPKAIKYLEDYCTACPETHSQNYLKATICLIKAYQMGGQLHRAITLCQSLINHSHPQVNAWANKILAILSK